MKIIKISNEEDLTTEEHTEVDTAVMVVVNDLGEVLVLKRGSSAPWMPNKWNLPGGGIEDGEDWADAAERECSEEAGFFPSNIKPIGVFDNVAAFIGNHSGEVNVNFESSEYAWITTDQIEQFDLVHPIKSILSTIK